MSEKSPEQSEQSLEQLQAEAEMARLQIELAKAQADAAQAKIRAAQVELMRAELLRKQEAVANAARAAAAAPAAPAPPPVPKAPAPKAPAPKPPAVRTPAVQAPSVAASAALAPPIEPVPDPTAAGRFCADSDTVIIPPRSLPGTNGAEPNGETVAPQPAEPTVGVPAPPVEVPAVKNAAPPASAPPVEQRRDATPAKQTGGAEKGRRAAPSAPQPATKAPPVRKTPAAPSATPLPGPSAAPSAAPTPAPTDAPVAPLAVAIAPAAAPVATPVVEAAALPSAGAPVPADAIPEVPPDEPEPSARSNFLRTMNASMVSVIVHMVVLIVLAVWSIQIAREQRPLEIFAVSERPDELLTQVLDRQLDPSTNVQMSSPSATSINTGHGTAVPSSSEEPKINQEAVESASGPAKKIAYRDFSGVPGVKLQRDVREDAPGEPQAVVNDLQEAMDRITIEILNMLQKNKVLVVWMFDESESMKDERDEIRAKIERVYAELGLKGATQGNALMTGIVSYGTTCKIWSTDPTSDLDKIREYMDKVPVDDTGTENMCASVSMTIRAFREYASKSRRQMAVIMVTDESGEMKSNVELLETAVNDAKEARCRIYVLGRESVFGYPWCYMNWEDPKTQINYWLQIDRGPESAFVEQLQTEGFWRRYDAHASGFGPYEQTRLARETGGVFFMLPSPELRLVGRDQRKYVLGRLRPYMPSLEPRHVYEQERNQSELRAKLWYVINVLNPWNPQQAPHIVMRQDFTINLANLPAGNLAFAREAQVEIAKSIRYLEFLDLAQKEMEKIKPLRDKEIYPRWQANYDLVYAQIITFKVRVHEYAAYLDWFVKNPKVPNIKPPNPRTTATWWRITYRRDTLTDESTKSDQQFATDLFNKIIQEHAGTPWASRAEDELRRGFGVELYQHWDDPRRGQGVKLPKL
ncbi:MAG: VWA domain-containing protein [Planctomycetia bacterium]|nr:VWA domain-containing protein [Planctomycetia bacterium]